MTTIYRLNANELSAELINSIKAAFKGKEIEITVTQTMDETDYLLSSETNKELLYNSLKELEEGKGVSFTVEELKQKYGQ